VKFVLILEMKLLEENYVLSKRAKLRLLI